MKPEIAKIWTDALRSGKYEQGQHWLRSLDDKFCCLGVLCEQAVEAGIIEPAISTSTRSVWRYESNEGVLPAAVQRWAGMRTPSGSHGAGRLTVDNDRGQSFLEIADIIDANVETL